MRRAVYPGTFDPITLGHVDIARRAATLFDEVLVAVGTNPGKRPLFATAERLRMAREALRDIPNLTVEAFEGLLVGYLRERGARIVVRGLRTPADLEYERRMAFANGAMMPDLETVFLAARPEYALLNARLLKEVASLGGDVSAFVPAAVAERLKEKFGP